MTCPARPTRPPPSFCLLSPTPPVGAPAHPLRLPPPPLVHPCRLTVRLPPPTAPSPSWLLGRGKRRRVDRPVVLCLCVVLYRGSGGHGRPLVLRVFGQGPFPHCCTPPIPVSVRRAGREEVPVHPRTPGVSAVTSVSSPQSILRRSSTGVLSGIPDHGHGSGGRVPHVPLLFGRPFTRRRRPGGTLDPDGLDSPW